MKRFLSATLGLLCVLVLGACAYVYRPLGQLPEGERLKVIQASPHFRDGVFQNEIATPPRPGGLAFIWAVLRGRFEPIDRPAPPAPIPSVKTDLAAIPLDQDVVIWLGHSSFYVQVGGKRLLIDPVFSKYAAPLPWMVRAYEGTNLYSAEDMPEIDAVLISHDHYDHLDYGTMKSLEPKAKLVLAGLGNGAHLEHWGYSPEKIREVDWLTTVDIAPGVQVHALPAQHYSGRFMKRNQSLWVSFAVQTPQRKLYFGGDSGFGPHFESIGKRFGKFDLVAVDSGQYNEKWADIHMTPEEASRAADLLGAGILLPAHAGRFTLARHSWDEPFERALAASKGKNYRLLTPLVGEPVRLGVADQQFKQWWTEVK